MNCKNFYDGQDIPLGLSMAMAQNPQAMSYFAKLTAAEKQAVINEAKHVSSKAQMQQMAETMAHNETPIFNSFQ